ncbi:hypothetical protein [Rhodoglobus aureus]|uniref:Uncharacterized protein n=1 Tax=Rhodoglobus aureus TaxID=191497 RepID=A0ABP4G391_9MICO
MDAALPIVIDEEGNLMVYPTVEMACLEMEAIDVVDGVYEAFDGHGRRLKLVAHGEFVSIAVPPDAHPEPAELERRLRKYIDPELAADLGIENVDDASLPALVHALFSYQRGETARSGYGTWNQPDRATRVGWERHAGRLVFRISARWLPIHRHRGYGRIELLSNGPRIEK